MPGTREEAFALLCQHTPSEMLRRHALAVEAAMRGYARKLGEDEELWGMTGLLHDFDYDQHADEHPLWGVRLLREQGWPERLIRAVEGHYPEKTGVHPETPMERHLVACDEWSGFLLAVAYVRPSKSIHEVEVKSVVKKLKQVAFAAAVNRDELAHAVELVGLSVDEHVGNMLDFLRSEAQALGVDGPPREGPAPA